MEREKIYMKKTFFIFSSQIVVVKEYAVVGISQNFNCTEFPHKEENLEKFGGTMQRKHSPSDQQTENIDFIWFIFQEREHFLTY